MKQCTRDKLSRPLPWLIMSCVIAYAVFDNHRQNKAIKKHLQILHEHVAWMDEITNGLHDVSTDGWKRAHSVKTWEQFYKENPSLQEPEDFEPKRLEGKVIIWPYVPKTFFENKTE